MFNRNEDGKLNEAAEPQFVVYNPKKNTIDTRLQIFSSFTRLNGERVNTQLQITNNNIDFSKETIVTYDPDIDSFVDITNNFKKVIKEQQEESIKEPIKTVKQTLSQEEQDKIAAKYTYTRDHVTTILKKGTRVFGGGIADGKSEYPDSDKLHQYFKHGDYALWTFTDVNGKTVQKKLQYKVSKGKNNKNIKEFYQEENGQYILVQGIQGMLQSKDAKLVNVTNVQEEIKEINKASDEIQQSEQLSENIDTNQISNELKQRIQTIKSQIQFYENELAKIKEEPVTLKDREEQLKKLNNSVTNLKTLQSTLNKLDKLTKTFEEDFKTKDAQIKQLISLKNRMKDNKEAIEKIIEDMHNVKIDETNLTAEELIKLNERKTALAITLLYPDYKEQARNYSNRLVLVDKLEEYEQIKQNVSLNRLKDIQYRQQLLKDNFLTPFTNSFESIFDSIVENDNQIAIQDYL